MNTDTHPVELATELTIAWLSNPNTRTTPDDIPGFLQTMHAAVLQLSQPEATESEQPATDHVPAVSVRKSLASRDHLISLIDGKPYKTLRRHLSTHGLTPDDYRQRYGLRADYPMVAPAYSESRSAMAKTLGLGRKAGTKIEKAASDTVKTARKGGKAALQAAKATLGSDE